MTRVTSANMSSFQVIWRFPESSDALVIFLCDNSVLYGASILRGKSRQYKSWSVMNVQFDD